MNFAHLKPLCPELSQELVWIWVWGIHTWGVWAPFRLMFDLGAGMCRSCQAPPLCRLTHQHKSLNTNSLIILCNTKRRGSIFIEFSHFTCRYRQILNNSSKNSLCNLSQVQQNLIIIIMMQLFCLWRCLLFPDSLSPFLQCGTADMLLWTLTEPMVWLHTPLEVMKCDAAELSLDWMCRLPTITPRPVTLSWELAVRLAPSQSVWVEAILSDR